MSHDTMGCLQDHVIIITGAGRGIGRAEALRCAQEGARLVIDDLGCDVEGRGADPGVILGVAEELRALGADVVSSELDLRAPETPKHLVALAMDSFGRIDGLICNAGVARERTAWKLDDEELDAVFDVQARSAFRITPLVLDQMIRQRSGGALLYTVHPSGLFGAARQAHVAAASGAVLGYARSVATEARRHQVRVNVIAPMARTRATENLPMFRGIRPSSLTPEQIADVAAWLMSPDAQDVTGEAFGIAGTRLYALKARETAGAFASGERFTLDELSRVWPDAVRG